MLLLLSLWTPRAWSFWYFLQRIFGFQPRWIISGHILGSRLLHRRTLKCKILLIFFVHSIFWRGSGYAELLVLSLKLLYGNSKIWTRRFHFHDLLTFFVNLGCVEVTITRINLPLFHLQQSFITFFHGFLISFLAFWTNGGIWLFFH